jgi:outer membrane protein
MKPRFPCWMLAGLLAVYPAAAGAAPLTLAEAATLAVNESKVAQIARLKVQEAAAALKGMEAQRYPIVTAFGFAGYTPRPYEVNLGAGALSPMVDALGMKFGLGPLTPTIGPFPASDVTLLRGRRDLYVGGVTIVQPLSQQWRIGSGIAASRAGQTEAQRESARIEAQVRCNVEELFAGVLLENRRLAALAAKLAFQQAQLRDAEHAQSVGELLDDAVLGLRAELTQAEATLIRSEQTRQKLGLQLGDLIGRAGTAQTELDETLPVRMEHPLAYWLGEVAKNPDRQVAAAVVGKAAASARAARQADIPDIGLFAAGYAQDGMQLVPDQSAVFGVMLKWDVFDFGRRRADERQARLRLRQAELNRDRVEEEGARATRLAWQDFEYAARLIELAERACAYRQRAAELARQSVAGGLALESKRLSADADLRQAEADRLGAQLQRHLALLRLYWLAGAL